MLVVVGHEGQHPAGLAAATNELIQIAEDVEDDVQTGEAQEADEKRLHELPQQVPVDDVHDWQHRVIRANGSRRIGRVLGLWSWGSVQRHEDLKTQGQ